MEYDVEVEPEEPKKEGSMDDDHFFTGNEFSKLHLTGIVVGGLVVAGTLSYVVYRGLSTN